MNSPFKLLMNLVSISLRRNLCGGPQDRQNARPPADAADVRKPCLFASAYSIAISIRWKVGSRVRNVFRRRRKHILFMKNLYRDLSYSAVKLLYFAVYRFFIHQPKNLFRRFHLHRQASCAIISASVKVGYSAFPARSAVRCRGTDASPERSAAVPSRQAADGLPCGGPGCRASRISTLKNGKEFVS